MAVYKTRWLQESPRDGVKDQDEETQGRSPIRSCGRQGEKRKPSSQVGKCVPRAASGHLILTFEPQGELSPIIGFKGIKSKMTLIKSFRAAAR